eukprot:scaffold6271_cov171-Amphora_coffeaeformis.AAC.10
MTRILIRRQRWLHDAVSKYISGLFDTIEDLKGEEEEAGGVDGDDSTPMDTTDGDDFPPVYESGEDYDKAGDAKQQAADLKASGDWEGALAKYTEAVLAAPPSALLYANRAYALLQLGRHSAAERDCDLALKENPDSAKALRMRGKARKELGKYELALKDLAASQQIDFDEGTVEDLKFLTEKHLETEKADAEKRKQEKERLRKRAEEIKKAKEEAKREAKQAKSRGQAAGMGGMPGGMPPGMADMMNDPEFLAGMQNPKIQAAFQELMSGPGGPMGLMQNPAKLQELMADPEVGPFLQKLMGKFGGMGGAGGMPGSPGGGPPSGGNDDGDDIPDMPDISEVD